MELEPLKDDDPRTAGQYHLRGRLRASRVGTTYLGRSPEGLFAEVTVVHPQLAWDPRLTAALSDDLGAARRVHAPHVQRLRGADLRGRAPWFAADYLPGPTLRDAVAEHGPLPPAAVRSLAGGMARALDAVHAEGLVHRGLNPSVVVLTADDPAVTGLGVERALELATATVPRLVPDAVAYLPPEVAGGAEPGAPGDIFRLGAVLTYAATGHGPFGSGDSAELARRVRNDAPDLAGVPDDLLAVVTACVRAAPGERPTLAALQRRLASGQAGSWDLPAGLAASCALWAGLGRGRSAPLAPALAAEPTVPVSSAPDPGPPATKKLRADAADPVGGGVDRTERGGESRIGPTSDAGKGPPPRPVSILPRRAGDDEPGARPGQDTPSRLGPLLLVAVAVAAAALAFAAVTIWR